MKSIKVPVTDEVIENLEVGDKIKISGKIYTGRDAALPKLVKSLKNGKKLIEIKGSAIMHTAVSDAGISPTTSNKDEIQGCIPDLAKAGVKIHIGKGALSDNIIKALNKENSIYIVTPPVAALLKSKIKSKKIVAFAEEGIEAIFELEVYDIPGVVAVAHGKSIYSLN